MDEPPRLHESHPARARAGDCRRNGRVHAIEIHREVIAPAIGDTREDRFHSEFVQLVSGDEMCAIGSGRLDLLYPCTSSRAETDLKNFINMRHFGGSANWT